MLSAIFNFNKGWDTPRALAASPSERIFPMCGKGISGLFWGAMFLLLGFMLSKAAFPAEKRKIGKKEEKSAEIEYTLADWKGPEKDFKAIDGRIVGEWWQGGGLGVVYFTGPHAQKLAAFERVGRKIAARLKRPYLEIHKEHMRPSADDENGIIAYPDGTARVQLFLMPGGNGGMTVCDIADIPTNTTSPEKLAEICRVPQGAFKTGMNYVGVCGGCFIATSGVDKPNFISYGWRLWPGKFADIGPGGREPFPDVVFDPALKNHFLYKATENGRLRNMFFNGGPLRLESEVPDTEYLGKYVGGNIPEIIDTWFCIAYRPKDNGLSGRCVIATGHPEARHERFLEAMCDYALQHDYEVPRKPIKPEEKISAVVGDNQMHYYCLSDVPAGKKLSVSLTGLSENCDLYLRFNLPPLFGKKDAASKKAKVADEAVTISATKAGEYWIGVHGNHQKANGAQYELQVSISD